jgi:hypothetical protein
MQTHDIAPNEKINSREDNINGKKKAPVLSFEDFTGESNYFTNTTEITSLIEQSRINLDEPLSPPPVAMQIMSDNEPVTLFTKGNFSIVTGAAKSRKTFLISMLMAAAIKGYFQDLFFCLANGINLLFDTEQSRYKAQQIAKRICRLSESAKPENLQVYSLRTLDPSQRLELIEQVLESTPNINFVCIDGIIDLQIDPILQADQAQMIVSKLMKWTEFYNIHIVCVLHYNKTIATLLGHLGSFSHRKADAIISVTKSKDDQNISLVEPVDCREKEFSPFAFSVDNSGMPFILEQYAFEKKPKPKETGEPKGKGTTPNQMDEYSHTDILNLCFAVHKEQGYAELWRNIKNAIEKITANNVGDNKSKDFLTYYLNNGCIIKTEIMKKKPVYTLAGQKAMF